MENNQKSDSQKNRTRILGEKKPEAQQQRGQKRKENSEWWILRGIVHEKLVHHHGEGSSLGLQTPGKEGHVDKVSVGSL